MSNSRSTLRLQTDSGASATDRITNTVTVLGTASDNIAATRLLVALDATGTPSFTNLSVSPAADGKFTISRAQLNALAGGNLADGAHTLHIAAEDAEGNRSTVALFSFTLDTQAPTGAAIGLASADALNGNDAQTSAAIATLRGTAEPGSTVSLAGQDLSALVGANGSFQLPGVAFAVGDNTLSFTVADVAGNTQTISRTIVRSVQVQADAVLAWNNIALRAIQLDVTDPPVATRTLAMISLAQYDALAAIEGTPAFLVQRSVSGAVNAQAAAATAAHQILSRTYPAQKAIFDAALASQLTAMADGAANDTGIALGLNVADAIWAARSTDGSKTFADYSGGTAVGLWRPTGPTFELADDPQWKSVTPFALSSPSQLRPSAPPALDTAAYAQAVNEVKALGSAASATRTADQTQQLEFDTYDTQVPDSYGISIKIADYKWGLARSAGVG